MLSLFSLSLTLTVSHTSHSRYEQEATQYFRREKSVLRLHQLGCLASLLLFQKSDGGIRAVMAETQLETPEIES